MIPTTELNTVILYMLLFTLPFPSLSQYQYQPKKREVEREREREREPCVSSQQNSFAEFTIELVLLPSSTACAKKLQALESQTQVSFSKKERKNTIEDFIIG